MHGLHDVSLNLAIADLAVTIGKSKGNDGIH